jgi:hypothetical protein
MKENQKIKSAERLLHRTWPLPCKSGKTAAAIFCPAVARTQSLLLQKLLCLAAAQASIILPDFVRSLSADVSLFKVLPSQKTK